MKNFAKIIVMLLLLTNGYFSMAQEESDIVENPPLDYNYFQISPRIGFDSPSFNNNTPYIDYKSGPGFGASVDYYWNWFGLGADIDYITNSPESTYPTSNLYESDLSTPINSFNLSEDKVTRMFYGVGPNLQYRTQSGTFKAELNTRIGLASVKGGRTYLEGVSTTSNSYLLNFHAGYKDAAVLSAKGQLRFTYFLNENLGINLGGYYMKHFGAKEAIEMGISTSYMPFSEQALATKETVTVIDGNTLRRSVPCECDISSIGAFVGITYKLNKKETPKEPVAETEDLCPVCLENHVPNCCNTCGCGLTITARDKFTGEILPETDIVLKDKNGQIVQSGTTNSYGVVVFKDVMEDNYIISGKLYNVNLEDEILSKEAFKDCRKESGGIQKEILYTNQNFILKGRVVECNVEQGIQNVDIQLKDSVNSELKNTISNMEGDFMFHLKQVSSYTLKGRKDGYYSNEVEISTDAYNRDDTLFIDFEMCVDPCGKAIKLDNINFDLDKAEILPAAIPDLERIVKLMTDNPHIQVEMSSHTDSQGSDAYNQKLSQRRADATVNYIVNRGISKDRLIARGAGESELKNKKCANNVPCTDDEHRINRRTEFKVICF